MPKIIENADGAILATARRILTEKGYAAFSLRDIARDSGVSVGTIYNRFSDKEELMARVMIADWKEMLQRTDALMAEARDIAEGLSILAEGIREFAALYRNCWAEFADSPRAGDAMRKKRHLMLRVQLEERVLEQLERFFRESDAAIAPLLAETVLAAAMQEDIGPDPLKELLRRMGY